MQHSLCPTSLSDISLCLTVKVLSRLLTRSSWERVPGFRVPHKWQICEVRPILSADWATSPYKLRWTLITCQFTILVGSVSFSFSLFTYLRQLRNVQIFWPYPLTRALNRYWDPEDRPPHGFLPRYEDAKSKRLVHFSRELQPIMVHPVKLRSIYFTGQAIHQLSR